MSGSRKSLNSVTQTESSQSTKKGLNSSRVFALHQLIERQTEKTNS